VQFSAVKRDIENLIKNFSKDGFWNLRFKAQGFARLFDRDINLGPITITLLGATPSEETANRFSNLDELPDDSIIQVELEVDDPGITLYYDKWLPADN